MQYPDLSGFTMLLYWLVDESLCFISLCAPNPFIYKLDICDDKMQTGQWFPSSPLRFIVQLCICSVTLSIIKHSQFCLHCAAFEVSQQRMQSWVQMWIISHAVLPASMLWHISLPLFFLSLSMFISWYHTQLLTFKGDWLIHYFVDCLRSEISPLLF